MLGLVLNSFREMEAMLPTKQNLKTRGRYKHGALHTDRKGKAIYSGFSRDAKFRSLNMLAS